MSGRSFAAIVPVSSLTALADLRREGDLRVAIIEDRAWLIWDAKGASFTHRVMSLPEARLYSRADDGLWRAVGSRLPVFDLPLDRLEFTTLVHAITPLPLGPAAAPTMPLAPASLRLVRSNTPRVSTALICGVEVLAEWAGSAPTAQVERLSVAICEDRALVRARAGDLPTLSEEARFWGDRILRPIGWHVDPDLPERALLRCLDGDEDAVLVLHEAAECEFVPFAAFGPLSRASVRLAATTAKEQGVLRP